MAARRLWSSSTRLFGISQVPCTDDAIDGAAVDGDAVDGDAVALHSGHRRGRPQSPTSVPAGASKAEREGFEPSDPVSQVNSLAVSPIRPLSHLSLTSTVADRRYEPHTQVTVFDRRTGTRSTRPADRWCHRLPGPRQLPAGARPAHADRPPAQRPGLAGGQLGDRRPGHDGRPRSVPRSLRDQSARPHQESRPCDACPLHPAAAGMLVLGGVTRRHRRDP